MISLSLKELADITGGTLINGADPEARVVAPAEFDSRKIEQGGLFLALPGESVDGHDFIDAAYSNGATIALVGRDVDAPALRAPDMDGDPTSAVFEHDASGAGARVLGALGSLARYIVDTQKDAHDLKVIGVTGSAGKTSTKDFLATIISNAGETIAPPGSFNNEIGHPYTAVRVNEDTDYLVAEMSARGVGHIAHLAHIAPPDVGVVLNVGSAHVGEFGGKDKIAQAKGELIESLNADGLGILNRDDPLVWDMRKRSQAPVVSFSAQGNQDAQYYATDISLNEDAEPSFILHAPQGQWNITLRVSGYHQVANALAAASVGFELDLDPDQVIQSVQSHTAASAHRMDIRRRTDGLVIIDDSYNANPESMRAGIAALQAAGAESDGASWAVLGQMGELGDSAPQEHSALADVLVNSGIEHLIVVGQGENQSALVASAQHFPDSLSVVQVDDAEQAAQLLSESVSPQDKVLVKASNSEKLWTVADALESTESGGSIKTQ